MSSELVLWKPEPSMDFLEKKMNNVSLETPRSASGEVGGRYRIVETDMVPVTDVLPNGQVVKKMIAIHRWEEY